MKKIIAIAFLFFIAGCSKIPDCGDEKAFDLLSEIMIDRLAADVDPKIADFIRKHTKFEFEGVTITSNDEKLSKKTCKATAVFKSSNEDMQKIEDLTRYPALDRAVSLRWELLTEFFTQQDYLNLANSRVEAEKYQDTDLVKEIDALLALDNVKPVDMQRAMRMANIWVKQAPAAITLRNATVIQLRNNDGKIKFPIEYKIEKLEDKKNPFQISARFDEKSIEGILYFELVLYSYNQQMQSKSTLMSILKNEPQSNPSVNKVAPSASESSPVAPPPVPSPTESPAPASSSSASTGTSFAPSFDCAKATAVVEKLICGDKDLAKIDVDLNTAYLKAREKSTDPKQLQVDQRNWIKTSRNTCSDKTCLIGAYKQRIAEVSK